MAGSGRLTGDPALVVAVAAGMPIKQAAEEAGMSERTAHRRLADPAIQTQIAEARAATIRQATDRLSAASVAAVTTLLRLLAPPTPPATRLGAAKTVLELGAKLRESQELEARLTALEERIGHKEKTRWAS